MQGSQGLPSEKSTGPYHFRAEFHVVIKEQIHPHYLTIPTY